MSPTKPTFVLVHGAWHSAWHYAPLVAALSARGYASHAVSNPSVNGTGDASQADDVAAIRATLLPLVEAGGHVVTVFHSYGGYPGGTSVAGLSLRSRAAAGHAGGVLGMVYLASIIAHEGDDPGQRLEAAAQLGLVLPNHPSEGVMWMDDPAKMFYAPDTPAELVPEAVRRLKPQSMKALYGIVGQEGWAESGFDGRRSYIRCAKDQALPQAAQDAIIEAAGGEERWIVKTLEGVGHSPFLSQPEALAAMLEELAGEFESN